MKSNLKEGDLKEDRDQIWWNQVKADIRKIGMAEEDSEDLLKLGDLLVQLKCQLKYKQLWE